MVASINGSDPDGWGRQQTTKIEPLLAVRFCRQALNV